MAKVWGARKELAEAMKWREGEPVDVYLKRSDAALKEVEDAANALPEGEVVGALIRFPVADGYAMYRVIKAKPLELEHIPFGDAWNAHPVLLRGLRLSDVKKMVDGERRLNAIFSKRKVAS